MEYNIQFQIAAFLFTLSLIFIFLFKPKSKNRQNNIFLAQIIVVCVLMAVDVISCIFIAERNRFPKLNVLFGKAYILLMLVWLSMIMDYIFECVTYPRMPVLKTKLLLISKWLIYSIAGILSVITVFTELKFGGEGRFVYSYGISSVCTYAFSAFCALLAFLVVFMTWNHIPVRRKIPVFAFVLAQGIPALLQFFFKGTLLLSLGGAVGELIMYMALENPDLEFVARIDGLIQENFELFEQLVPKKIAKQMDYRLKPYYEEYKKGVVAFFAVMNFNDFVLKFGMKKATEILNSIYKATDDVLDKYGVSKIKVFGGMYQVALGLLTPLENDCQRMLEFLIEVRRIVHNISEKNDLQIDVCYGVDYDSVAASFLGNKQVSYELLGGASEMAYCVCSLGMADHILVTDSVRKKVEDSFEFTRMPPQNYPEFGIVHVFSLKLQ